MKASQVMYKAIEQIQRRGLHKGHYVADNTDINTAPICGHGAIYAALRLDYNFINVDAQGEGTRVMREAIAALNATAPIMPHPKTGELTRHFPWYNDLDPTSQEDVLLKMKEAAYNLEQEGK